MEKKCRRSPHSRIQGAITSLSRLSIPLHAASAGFFIVLSVFPALVLLLGVLRYANLQAERLPEILGGIIPQALTPGLADLIGEVSASASGTLVGISVLTALWSASRGIYGLLLGLNAVYGIRESRGYLQRRLVSAACTLALLLLLPLLLIFHLCAQALLPILRTRPESLAARAVQIPALRWLFLLAGLSGIFALMFCFLPDHRSSLRRSFPGAVFSAVGWLVFGQLYGIYVAYFTPLSSIYGSVYAVALSMLWLYCCLCIFFYGGALNHALEQRKFPDA